MHKIRRIGGLHNYIHSKNARAFFEWPERMTKAGVNPALVMEGPRSMLLRAVQAHCVEVGGPVGWGERAAEPQRFSGRPRPRRT